MNKESSTVNGPIEVRVCIIELMSSLRESQERASFMIRISRRARRELTTFPL